MKRASIIPLPPGGAASAGQANPHKFASGAKRPLMLLLLIGFCCAAFFAPAPSIVAQDAGTAMEWNAYRQLIERAAAELAEPSANTESAARWQRELAAIQRVGLPTGDVVEIAPLLGSPEDEATLTLERARARISIVQSQLAASAGDRTADRLAQLETVLARDEFAVRESIWQRVQRWLGDYLGRFVPESLPDLGEVDSLRPLARVAGWLIVIAGSLLLIWLFSFWAQELLANFVPNVDRREPGDQDDNLPSSALEARTSATELAEVGDFRQAIRRLYLAALLSLDERQLLRYERSLTNREVLARVPDHTALKARLEPVIATFDRVWYGVHEPDRPAFEKYRREVEELEYVMIHGDANDVDG